MAQTSQAEDGRACNTSAVATHAIDHGNQDPHPVRFRMVGFVTRQRFGLNRFPTPEASCDKVSQRDTGGGTQRGRGYFESFR